MMEDWRDQQGTSSGSRVNQTGSVTLTRRRHHLGRLSLVVSVSFLFPVGEKVGRLRHRLDDPWCLA